MGISNLVVIVVCGLALVIIAAVVQFIFNPLGLGPEPDSVLAEEFFKSPAENLSGVELLVDGGEAFQAALDAIDSAETSIVVQTFIWRDDNIGRKTVKALIAAADRGVMVSVSKDALGTFFELGGFLRGRPSPVFADSAFKTHKNINVSVDLFADTDHSKYFLIDNSVVVFGGMNIADEYHNKWHDYMVKIENRRWAGAFGDKVLRSIPWPAEAPYFIAVNDRRATEIRTALLQIINRAKQSVTLEHAYFSDDKVIGALKNAVARGVRVDVILPKAPATHHHANMATANRLLESSPAEKINVFFYPRMTHAKVALVDGVIAAVGSANLTPRSMLTSREVTLFAHGKPDNPFIEKLRKRLEADMDESERVVEPFRLSVVERIRAVLGKYIW